MCEFINTSIYSIVFSEEYHAFYIPLSRLLNKYDSQIKYTIDKLIYLGNTEYDTSLFVAQEIVADKDSQTEY